MKRFFTGDTTTETTDEHTKKLESFKMENKALKEQLGSSVPLGNNHEENSKKLKEMLAVIEVLRQLENKELAFDLTDSEKFHGGISIGVQDTSTKKIIFAVYAEGKDKKEKARRFGRFSGYTYYEYLLSKAVLVFPNETTQIPVPKFLLEEFGWKITDHINSWSENKDKAVLNKLDTVLSKLGT